MFDEPIRHRLPGALLLLLGCAIDLAIAAADHATGWGPFVAALGLLLAAVGALDVAGAFDPEDGDDDRAIEGRALVPRLGRAAAALVVLVVVLRAATAGLLGVVPAAFAVPTAFLALALAVTPGPSPWKRHGLWLVAGATLLYLPLLGSFALVDPWETHYGEVAREMIARNDWISPWWAQDRWFFSKPVLDLWLEALSMRALGVHAASGAMLVASGGVTPRPEWALRLPSFLLAVAGLGFLHAGVRRVFGARAALLSVFALATMPQFLLMARQATTDMPLVGSLAAALGLMLIAFAANARERTPSMAVRLGARVLRLDLAALVLAGAVALILPQALYLLARHVTLHTGAHVSVDLHADVFWSGSPGNCELPANAPCAKQAPLSSGFPPALQALVWIGALAGIVFWNRKERRLERVSYLAAFLCAAIATMAKGPLGVALPGCAFLAMLLVTGRWKRLARAPLATGTLVVLAATLPWYVAVYARHGAAFTDELVFRHMIGRATSHLHDTNQGDDVSFRFYVWQLGYALFGWAGLAPVALSFWPASRATVDANEAPVERSRRAARALAILWVALAFALFTAMPTKFHHYIFPALPGVALLTGLLLDELLGAAPRVRPGPLSVALIGGAVLVLLVARDLATPGVAGEARLLNLVTYNYQRPWPETVDARHALGTFGVAFAAMLALAAVPRIRRLAIAGLLAASAVFAVWGDDVYLVELAPHWGQRALVEAYLKARTSELDPIAAFNMNWKGENFYTGNHVAVFPAGGKITTWMDARRAAGARAFFFLVEHGRMGALKSEVGVGKTLAPLTTKADHNKFVLVEVTDG